jgi:glucosamine kinase
MTNPLFIGVDGGGTRTRARIRDDSGALLGEGLAGPGNAGLGEAAFAEIMKASRAALADAGLAEAAFSRMNAGFGLAGAAQAQRQAMVKGWPHPFRSLAVCSDAYAAWLGAFEGRDGAILIAGTGSCGLAVVEGRSIEVGGLGAAIGDEGSGMAIGRAAVRRSMWALDGLAPMTPLAAAVLADPRIGNDRDRAVIWSRSATPGDFADFVPMVFDHAERGEPVATAIVDEAARDLDRLAKRLTALVPPPIAMVGTVFGRIVPWLPEEMRTLLVKPARDAADGAIVLARTATAEADA